MATKEEIDSVMKIFRKERPRAFVKEMNSKNMGIGAVIRYLSESQAEENTAGDISKFLNVSTARVAVILQRMENKGLITKSKGKDDARLTIVCLTEHGRDTAEKMQSAFKAQIGMAIDTVGYERMLEFVKVMQELCGIIAPPKIDDID